MMARFATAAWVGAAVLFVVTSVSEISHPQLDSVTRNLLPQIRFPAYYATGFTLLGGSLLATLAAAGHPQLSRWRHRTCVALLGTSVACMCVDYAWIYTPLLAMLKLGAEVKPSEFVGYHQASETINGIGLVLAFVAAGLLSAAPWSADAAPHNASV